MKPSHSNVLLVDDDPAILRLLSQWLKKDGYEVSCVEDGLRAITAIEAKPPDFLVTDWEMPEMNGLELCRRVRELGLPYYIYILFLTSHASPDKIIEGLDVGADDFLAKPVRRGEMLARMRAGSRVIELERRLSLMARTDTLTGLFTRRTFFDLFEKEWDRSSRLHLPLSCVMLDLDFFKRINDVHGHTAGDTVLRTVADVLRDVCRASDTVCRYGGEEFCIMLPETTEENAELWAGRVCRRLADRAIPLDGEEIHVTASFGIAARRHETQSHETQTAEQLVDCADQALLSAKQSGRNRVIRYESLLTAAGGKPENLDEQGPFHNVLAHHVMSPVIQSLQEEDTIEQAAELFLRVQTNFAPVVDGKNCLTGIVSEKDLMAAGANRESWLRPVREVMRPTVVCYNEDTPLRVIHEFLGRGSLRQVIITRENQPVGTISRQTLLRWFRDAMAGRKSLEQVE